MNQAYHISEHGRSVANMALVARQFESADPETYKRTELAGNRMCMLTLYKQTSHTRNILGKQHRP